MTPLQKLRSIEELLINFKGNAEKLLPIARQMDILGSGIDAASDAYKELGIARSLMNNANNITKVLEHLANAESHLMDD